MNRLHQGVLRVLVRDISKHPASPKLAKTSAASAVAEQLARLSQADPERPEMLPASGGNSKDAFSP